jgi:hypothetical protein
MNRFLKIAAFFKLAIGLAEQPAVAVQPTILEASKSVPVQPTAPGFAPNSAQDDVIQGRITIFGETRSYRRYARQKLAHLSWLLALTHFAAGAHLRSNRRKVC